VPLELAFVHKRDLPTKWKLVRDLITRGPMDEDLRGVDLSNASLWNCNLSGADLSGANLNGADLDSADLSNANLTEASLCRLSFLASGVAWSRRYHKNCSGLWAKTS